MLLRFRVVNHASLRDEQELSLIADRHRDERAEGQVPRSELRTVPVAAIYGANASGKSNVIDAIGWMRYAVLWSFQRWNPSGGVPRIAFAFRSHAGAAPSEFDMDFVLDGTRYQYGFTCDDSRVLSEWLYDFPQGRMRRLFERGPDGLKFGRGLTGRRQTIADLLRPNSLYVSVAAAQGHPLLTRVREWFGTGLAIATDVDFQSRLDFTINRYLVDDGGGRSGLLSLLRLADLGVGGLEIDDAEAGSELQQQIEQLQSAFKEALGDKVRVTDALSHRVFARHITADGQFRLPLSDESSGTRTWIGLLGPVFSALVDGSTLCVDELDARLHPELAAVLVGLFRNPVVNVHRAQLIFSSHETSLLGPHTNTKLSRDEVWFTEKDHGTGASTLFPLTDFQERDAGNLEKRYMVGRFGAMPFLDEDAQRELVAEITKHRSSSETAAESQASVETAP